MQNAKRKTQKWESPRLDRKGVWVNPRTAAGRKEKKVKMPSAKGKTQKLKGICLHQKGLHVRALGYGLAFSFLAFPLAVATDFESIARICTDSSTSSAMRFSETFPDLTSSRSQ